VGWLSGRSEPGLRTLFLHVLHLLHLQSLQAFAPMLLRSHRSHHRHQMLKPIRIQELQIPAGLLKFRVSYNILLRLDAYSFISVHDSCITYLPSGCQAKREYKQLQESHRNPLQAFLAEFITHMRRNSALLSHCSSSVISRSISKLPQVTRMSDRTFHYDTKALKSSVISEPHSLMTRDDRFHCSARHNLILTMSLPLKIYL
jgi:hypothetical protein